MEKVFLKKTRMLYLSHTKCVKCQEKIMLEHSVCSCMLKLNAISGLHWSDLPLRLVSRSMAGSQDTWALSLLWVQGRARSSISWDAEGLRIVHFISKEQTQARKHGPDLTLT